MSNNTMTVFGSVPSAIEFINEMGNSIAKSKLAGCENPDQGKFFAMTCLARRCDPLYLAERYDIIKGRLRLKSVIMLAKLRRLGGRHRIIERTADAAEIELVYDGQTERFRITWQEASEEDFTTDKDGDVKHNYSTPRKRMQMLWYRVVSDGVAVMAPEVLIDEDIPMPVSEESSDGVPPVASVTPSASSVDASRDTSKEDDSVVDAEYTIEAEPEPDTRTEIAIDAPATESQRVEIIGLLRALFQAGQKDINDLVKKKLADNGIDGILGLTVKEADALIEALKVKQVKVWLESTIVGHRSGK